MLAPYVKCYWMVEAEAMSGPGEPERVMPDGCMEMIIHYGDRFQLIQDGQKETQSRAFVFGQIERFIDMMPSGRSGMIGVRFQPFGLQAFLDIPILHLNGHAVDLVDLFGREGRDLENRVLGATSFEQRARCVEQFLLLKFSNHQADPLIAHTIRSMSRNHGLTSMEALAMEHRLSVRTLERRFRQSAGLAPKTFARIFRFQNVFRLMETHPSIKLTQLALEAGYYDQAHFIREFREFAGMTPRAYFSNDHHFTDYFTATE